MNDWMKRSVGVSFHWTTHSVNTDGTALPFAGAVGAFDVDRFVRSLKKIGAGHVIFTLTHAEQYLAFPNETLESVLPGRTTKRDLIGEIIKNFSINLLMPNEHVIDRYKRYSQTVKNKTSFC